MYRAQSSMDIHQGKFPALQLRRLSCSSIQLLRAMELQMSSYFLWQIGQCFLARQNNICRTLTTTSDQCSRQLD